MKKVDLKFKKLVVTELSGKKYTIVYDETTQSCRPIP
jgi:hypothetical protein